MNVKGYAFENSGDRSRIRDVVTTFVHFCGVDNPLRMLFLDPTFTMYHGFFDKEEDRFVIRV